jgi:uncharacterized protein (TIRG00374 family)
MGLAKLAVTCGCLWYVGRRVDLRALADNFAHISAPLAAASFLALVLVAVLGGARWWVVMRATGHAARFKTLTELYWAGMLFNQVMPAAAGDTMRVWLSVRRGYRLQSAITSVVLERVFMLLVLLVIIVAAQPLLARLAPAYGVTLVPALALLGGVCGLALLAVADRISGRAASHHVLGRLLKWLAVLSLDTRRVMTSRWAWPMGLLCVGGNLAFVAAGWMLGQAMGLGLPFAAYLAFIPLAIAVTALPISVAGWGLREGLLVPLFTQAGISTHLALAFSLMYGALSAVSSLPGLVFWWLHADHGVSP